MSDLYLWFFIYSVLLPTILTLQCEWTDWSEDPKCRWSSSNCILTYNRTCLCSNGKLGKGDLCGNKNFYMETKAYASNFMSHGNICHSKETCEDYTTWCAWSSWSYWLEQTNTTCKRARTRKCCQTRPHMGYTVKSNNNPGCFVGPTNQSNLDTDYQIENRNCHTFFIKWKYHLIYVAIGLGACMIILFLCLCTKSTKLKSETLKKTDNFTLTNVNIIKENDKVSNTGNDDNDDDKEEKVSNIIQPTAPEIEPIPVTTTEKTAPPPTEPPLTPPPYNSIFDQAAPSAPNLPSQQPGTSSPDQLNMTQEKGKVKPKDFDEDDVTNDIGMNGVIFHSSMNASNSLPPPSYAIYSRNRDLFENS